MQRDNKHFLQSLREIPHTQIKENESMAKHTTFKIGGLADIFVQPSIMESCVQIIKLCREHEIPLLVLGGGSNMLVNDKGIQGVVLHTGELKKITVEENSITAQAGVSLSKLAETACQAGLAGLEFASGIPGTVGGAVYMNAGAYEQSISDVNTSVEVFTPDGIVSLANDKMEYTYRYSILHENKNIVLSAIFTLSTGNPMTIRNKMKELMDKRINTQPLKEPSAGSVFKRPPGHFAGKLIADSGLKGYSIGGAQVSKKHAGFIVNKGGATADDVLRLVEHIKKVVFQQYGVMLEQEIRLI